MENELKEGLANAVNALKQQVEEAIVFLEKQVAELKEALVAKDEEIERMKQQISPSDEISELQQKNSELLAEIEELKKQLSLPKELPSSGKKLQHATRARPSHRKAVSTAEPKAESPTEDNASPTERDEESIKQKLIAGMGGVNPLGGFNILAAINSSPVVRRPTQEAEPVEPVQVDEAILFKWIKETLESEQDYSQDSLRDGQLLCQLLNKIKGEQVVKINMGKFKFMQLENIKKYLENCTSFGVAPSYLFDPQDLLDGTNMHSVLENLTVLMNSSLNKSE